MESMLGALGLTLQAPPAMVAFKDGVGMAAPGAAGAAAQATAAPAATSSSGLSTGVIAGIAVGAAILLIVVIAGTVVLVRRRRAAAEEKRTAFMAEARAKEGDRHVGAHAKLSIKAANVKDVSDPFSIIKGGVDTPTSPTQRTYFNSKV